MYLANRSSISEIIQDFSGNHLSGIIKIFSIHCKILVMNLATFTDRNSRVQLPATHFFMTHSSFNSQVVVHMRAIAVKLLGYNSLTASVPVVNTLYLFSDLLLILSLGIVVYFTVVPLVSFLTTTIKNILSV